MVKYNSSKLRNLRDESDIPENDLQIDIDKLCVTIKDIFRQELTDYFNKHNDSKDITINGISFEEYIERVSNAYETSVKTTAENGASPPTLNGLIHPVLPLNWP